MRSGLVISNFEPRIMFSLCLRLISKCMINNNVTTNYESVVISISYKGKIIQWVNVKCNEWVWL